jgi:hypothetical protein
VSPRIENDRRESATASLPTASSFWACASQARQFLRCQSLELDVFDVDDDDDDEDAEPDDSEEDFEALVVLESDPDELLSPDEELSDDELSPDELSDEELSDDESSPDLPESLDDLPLPAAFDFCRLSVLKNPEPLKLTPTGWNTFFTAITSPDSGCANSESVSSLNDC